MKGIIKVAKQNDIPVLYNGAYTVGIMPVDGRDLGADFVVGSAHKSMASPAPSGVLAVTRERAEEVFRTTKAQADLTKRTFGIKEVEMMGCTLMGVTLVGMMASFPHVTRTGETLGPSPFKREYDRGRTPCSIDGTTVKSDTRGSIRSPGLIRPGLFDTVARTDKKRGFLPDQCP